jgi:hypothetical protein
MNYIETKNTNLKRMIQQETKGKHVCVICKKEYTKKSSLDDHTVLCEFKLKSKRENQIELEESADIPSYKDLVKIVQDMSLKMTKMEEKMEEMQKFIDTKRPKLNIVEWLNGNEHMIPSLSLEEWANKIFVVESQHFEHLMEHTVFETIQHVLDENDESLTEEESLPVQCFNQKNGLFYVFKKNDESISCWKDSEHCDIVSIIQPFSRNMMRVIVQWKTDNVKKINNSNKVSDSCNKAIIKLMNINYNDPSCLIRIKNILYNHLKRELKVNHFEI